MKHKDGTTASIPRVPSGALEGIQPKLLREACLAKEKPPLLIMRVLGAMCLLLEENPTWLVARQLIVDSETNMTMAGEDADTASKMSLIERLRNLNISRISEKTLHRLRRVVEHAGPNFSPEHLRSLESPHLSAFAPLCEYVLTAFDMAQLLFDDKWNQAGVAGELSRQGDNLGDETTRDAARKAIKERKEADRARERHIKAMKKAKKEQDEADEANASRGGAAQASWRRAAAKKAQDEAEKELNEVQAVKERLVQQREEAEADGQIDEDEEDAHNVLVRSMLRSSRRRFRQNPRQTLQCLKQSNSKKLQRGVLKRRK